MSALDEKRFTAQGRDWIARFDFNAICAVEERRGCAFLEVVAPMLQQLDTADLADQGRMVAAARAIRMSDIRLLFHQALLGAHADLSEAAAGDLIDAIGFREAMGIVAWAVARGLNVGGEDAAGDPNPPKTKGRRS